MTLEKHCGRRVAHEEHHWEEHVTRPPDALTGVDHTRHWSCPGEPMILVRRADANHQRQSYLVVTATEAIPAGAAVRVDTTTGTASLHYQPEAQDQ